MHTATCKLSGKRSADFTGSSGNNHMLKIFKISALTFNRTECKSYTETAGTDSGVKQSP